MEHKSKFLKLFFRVAIPLPLAFLTGCAAIAPGMHMNSQRMSPALNAHNQVVKQQIELISAPLLQRQAQEMKAEKQALRAHYHSPVNFRSNARDYHYRVQAQDTIQIVIWNEENAAAVAATSSMASMASGSAGGVPGLSNNTATGGSTNTLSNVFIVNSQGKIFYPYLGFVSVSGKTVTEIQSIIGKKVSRYLHNPQITVQVIGFNSQKVAVTGAVRNPSNLPITNVPLTVLSAVTFAGGPASCSAGSGISGDSSLCADLRHVTIQRGNQTATVDLNKLRAVDGSSNNWILRKNDVVFVPNMNDSRIFVLGAVVSPGPSNMVDDKFTLRDAIGDAHGVNTGSNPAYTYIIRNYRRNPKVYVLNLSSPDALNLAGDFYLKPGDVVFVSTSALQDMSTVVNQITPVLANAAYAVTLMNWNR